MWLLFLCKYNGILQCLRMRYNNSASLTYLDCCLFNGTRYKVVSYDGFYRAIKVIDKIIILQTFYRINSQINKEILKSSSAIQVRDSMLKNFTSNLIILLQIKFLIFLLYHFILIQIVKVISRVQLETVGFTNIRQAGLEVVPSM